MKAPTLFFFWGAGMNKTFHARVSSNIIRDVISAFPTVLPCKLPLKLLHYFASQCTVLMLMSLFIPSFSRIHCFDRESSGFVKNVLALQKDDNYEGENSELNCYGSNLSIL